MERRVKPDDIPIILFDRYIEIGDIKAAGDRESDRLNIEINVGSAFANKNMKRRSLESVINDITKLCKDKKAQLIFKSDEKSPWDALDWPYSVYLMLMKLDELGKLNSTVIYTCKSEEQIKAKSENDFRTQRDWICYKKCLKWRISS